MSALEFRFGDLSNAGCVISCNMGVYRLASTEGEAAALSLRAGVDMDFAGCSYSHLAAEIKSRRVNVSYHARLPPPLLYCSALAYHAVTRRHFVLFDFDLPSKVQ